MGQISMGTPRGKHNRGNLPPSMSINILATPVHATLVSDGILAMTPLTTECFGQHATMEGIGAMSLTPAFNHTPSRPEVPPNKCHLC